MWAIPQHLCDPSEITALYLHTDFCFLLLVPPVLCHSLQVLQRGTCLSWFPRKYVRAPLSHPCPNAAPSALPYLYGYTGDWSALALASFWLLSCQHYPSPFACQLAPSSSLDCGFSFLPLIVPSLKLSLPGYPASLQRYFCPNCSGYFFP